MGCWGTTVLVSHFIHAMQGVDGWRGAKAVYAWSFYSQGTDKPPPRFGRVVPGDRAGLVRSPRGLAVRHPARQGRAPGRAGRPPVRTLLVLDGLELLQYGPARRSGGSGDAGQTGGLKDQGLRALLRQLAASNPGLVVVTTRLRVPDLAGRPAPVVHHRASRADPDAWPASS